MFAPESGPVYPSVKRVIENGGMLCKARAVIVLIPPPRPCRDFEFHQFAARLSTGVGSKEIFSATHLASDVPSFTPPPPQTTKKRLQLGRIWCRIYPAGRTPTDEMDQQLCACTRAAAPIAEPLFHVVVRLTSMFWVFFFCGLLGLHIHVFDIELLLFVCS